MGRKIPAKKHRGVKDPLLQQARRFESLKDKINAPPRDPDEQPVPKSLTRLFGGRDARPSGRTRPLRRAQAARGGGPGPLAGLRRLPGETGRDFSRRITGAVRALHQADDALHYPGDEEEEEEARPPRRAPRPQAEQRDTRAQRRAAKLRLKKQKAAEAREQAARPELQYERVPFGDTAHAPPALARPRHATHTPVGHRSLLLAGAGASEQERRRLAAVAAYRELKRRAAGSKGGAIS